MYSKSETWDKNQVSTLLDSGELKSYSAALAEYEKAIQAQRDRAESGTREVEVKKIAYQITNKSGMTYFVEDAFGLDPKSRKAVAEIGIGDVVEVSGVAFGPLKIEKIQKITIEKIVPPSEEVIARPEPGDCFDFNMFSAITIAERHGGFDIPAGSHYNPVTGRVAFYCRQVKPAEERFVFVRTKSVEFLKFYWEDQGEDGVQQYKLERFTRSVMLVFSDCWQLWQVVEELSEAVNPSSVTNVRTSVESDGFWNK